MNCNETYIYRLASFTVTVLGALIMCSCNSIEDRFIEEGVVVEKDETKNEGRIAQNRWTYAQMQEHYLWEEYMSDSTTLNFTDAPRTFFNKLLYKGDRFSWMERNEDYRESLLYDRFGLEIVEYLLPTGGKVCRTALVLPHSPAEAAGLRRGDWFVITGTNVGRMDIETGKIEGIAFLPEKKLVLSANGSEYTDAIALDTIYQLQGKKIGYLIYNSFMDGMINFTYPYRTELRNIFGDFKDQGVTDLIIDLRYNPGGYVSICEIMCSLVLPDEYHGKISGYHSFNRKQAAKLLKETGNEEDILYFPTKNVIGNNNVGLRKIYCIITGRSASASESLINTLSSYIEVITVGSTSTGKNVGSYQCKDNRYEWQLQPVTFYYYNKEHKTVPETGIIPNIPVSENGIGVWYNLGDTREMLLNAALRHITGGSQMRSSVDYGKIQLTQVIDEGLQRRKVEGLVRLKNE